VNMSAIEVNMFVMEVNMSQMVSIMERICERSEVMG
jgi:hypothetical protein